MKRSLPAALLLLSACSALPADHRYPRSDHYDGRHFFNPDGEQGSGGEQKHGPYGLLHDLLFPPNHFWPHIPVTPTKPAARVTGQNMRVTWIGHSTVLVQTQGLNILTDPVWAERASPVQFAGVKRVREPGVRLHDLPHIDLVLISHDHYDHLDMHALRHVWKHDHPLIVTGLGNEVLLASEGITATARDWGQRVPVRPGIDVIVERAHHWSERRPGDHDRRLWCGFTVALPGGNLYFAGDTGAGDMKWAPEAARAGPVRLALLPIGAFHFDGRVTGNHIGPRDAVTAFEQLHAAYALGVHWGTFELTNEPIDAPPQGVRAAMLADRLDPARFRTTEVGVPWDVPAMAVPARPLAARSASPM